MEGRVLGLDVGTRRIGVAVSDESRLIARELTTIVVTSFPQAAQSVAVIVKELDITSIVIGLPLTMRGEEGEQARITRLFGASIGRIVKVPLTYVDERLTTKMSDAAMCEVSTKRSRRKIKRDSLAALFILQSYLDQQHR